MRIGLVVTAAALLVGCAPQTNPGVRAHSAVIPLTGPCPIDASAGTEFTTEAETLRLTINAPDIETPVEAEGDVEVLTIEKVPAGANRTLALFGQVGGAPVWRGVAKGITVTPNETTEVDVLMARVADFSCARSPDDSPRVFHTATVLDDGRILVVGGADQSQDASGTCAGCRKLVATRSAALYDPLTGTFQAVQPLVAGRMFHTATKLDDGRIVIAGGTSEAIARPPDTQFPFPLVPTIPVSTIEVFDPEGLSFSAGGSDPGGARVFAAATTTPNGEVIITGGIPQAGGGAGQPRHDLANALDTTTVCGGDPLFCRLGPTMQSRRAGHSAFRIDPDGVFLWGGSVETGDNGGIGGFQLEALKDNGQFQLLNVAAMSAARNVFFAATAQYVPFRIISAGGLVRNPDGSFRLAVVSVNDVEAGAVYVYDASFDVAGGIAVGPANGQAMHLSQPRFLAAAAPLTGNERAVIAGGYADLNSTPAAQVEIYDQKQLRVDPIAVGGSPRTLRQSRGGLAAATNGDGTVVFFGGETADPNGRVPLRTAEIFADPLPPPEVAE